MAATTEPRTEAGRRLLAQAGRLHILADDFATSIRAIEDEALASEREMAWHANRSARAALTAAIADIRGRHVRDVRESVAGPWCYSCGASWPCPDAALADRLEEATDGR